MPGPLLASVDPVTKRLPAATEATYAVALLKGLPNGVAEYDSDGDVVNAAGAKVGGLTLTGAQTVAGVKTFTDKPVVPDSTFAIAKVTGLQTELNGRATDAELASAVSDATAATQATTVQTPDSTGYRLLKPRTGVLVASDFLVGDIIPYYNT